MLNPTVTQLRENGHLMDSYPIDESQTNPNAGKEEVFLYNGEFFSLTEWNEFALEHELGEVEIKKLTE